MSFEINYKYISVGNYIKKWIGSNERGHAAIRDKHIEIK
jgi:hypothetical protein